MSLNTPQNKNRFFSPENPITKYLDQNGNYSPIKSEAIREEYKDERRKLEKQFNIHASDLFDRIVGDKKH